MDTKKLIELLTQALKQLDAPADSYPPRKKGYNRVNGSASILLALMLGILLGVLVALLLK